MATILLALISGLGAGLGHAPFHLWPVAFPAFALLIWSVSQAATPRAAFGRAWLAGLAYFALTLHWIVEPFLVDAATHGWMAPFALILLAGGLALFWAGAGWAAHRLGRSSNTRALGLAATLTVAELLRGHIFTGFPWAMPAYIWGQGETIWLVSLMGSYGLTGLTLGLAAALTLRTRLFAPQIAVLAIAAGLWALGTTDTAAPTSSLGTVALVHPNIPQAEKWDRMAVPGHITQLRDLTAAAAAAANAPDLIVLPEVAVVFPLDRAEQTLRTLAIAAGPAPLITGINRRDGDNWHNALVHLAPDGTQVQTYDKVHLVPFGEYIPFRLAFLRALAATTSNGFTPGSGVRLIDTPLGRALPLICYEGIFPRHLFKAGARADYILLMTNDAWFGTFAGPAQHFDQARFRAVEQGLPVVRVANRGHSAVIDAAGRVTASLSLDQTGTLSLPVPQGTKTLYARTGNIPLYVILLLTLAALLRAKRRNTIANHPFPS